MTKTPDILCIGSVLWDVIGRASVEMRVGNDMPGRITRLPGGVAMNIAMTLTQFGVTPALLSAIGRDAEGDALMLAAAQMGMITDHVYRADLPTDVYMAIEGANGLIAAIADAHSLEAAGDKILRALADGTLGDAAVPYGGVIALDGNLTEALLQEIAAGPVLRAADLRVAPASPGKAKRLLSFLNHPSATLYLNLEEAGLLCDTQFPDSASAVHSLCTGGVHRVLVTNGSNMAAEGTKDDVITASPPPVTVTRITGAGDTFMAAHIASELKHLDRKAALTRALNAAATYVSGETPS